MWKRCITLRWPGLIVAGAFGVAFAQNETPQPKFEVTAHLEAVGTTSKQHDGHVTPAVLWLKPVTPAASSSTPSRTYTLLQKNKMFTPHLLIVPVGSVVLFPNADPFFHNVFSLFDGRRFDLGLYEAGKTKEVTFSREGVSYIFCNIHSEMSAVVISLSTQLYSVADENGTFHIHDVPVAEYEMHVWVEGEEQAVLDRWTERVRISGGNHNLGVIHLAEIPRAEPHANKFGQPYGTDSKQPY
jgi:plastocyanin